MVKVKKNSRPVWFEATFSQVWIVIAVLRATWVRFLAGSKLLGITVLQPFKLGCFKVSHLKDLYHISLDLAAQVLIGLLAWFTPCQSTLTLLHNRPKSRFNLQGTVVCKNQGTVFIKVQDTSHVWEGVTLYCIYKEEEEYNWLQNRETNVVVKQTLLLLFPASLAGGF